MWRAQDSRLSRRIRRPAARSGLRFVGGGHVVQSLDVLGRLLHGYGDRKRLGFRPGFAFCSTAHAGVHWQPGHVESGQRRALLAEIVETGSQAAHHGGHTDHKVGDRLGPILRGHGQRRVTNRPRTWTRIGPTTRAPSRVCPAGKVTSGTHALSTGVDTQRSFRRVLQRAGELSRPLKKAADQRRYRRPLGKPLG